MLIININKDFPGERDDPCVMVLSDPWYKIKIECPVSFKHFHDDNFLTLKLVIFKTILIVIGYVVSIWTLHFDSCNSSVWECPCIVTCDLGMCICWLMQFRNVCNLSDNDWHLKKLIHFSTFIRYNHEKYEMLKEAVYIGLSSRCMNQVSMDFNTGLLCLAKLLLGSHTHTHTLGVVWNLLGNLVYLILWKLTTLLCTFIKRFLEIKNQFYLLMAVKWIEQNVGLTVNLEEEIQASKQCWLLMTLLKVKDNKD